MKIYRNVLIVILIIFIGAAIFIFISTENDNNDNIELTATSENINNDDNKNENSNISKNINVTNADFNNPDLMIEDPIFGKEGRYYYRGQENPIIDIEFYNNSVIFYDSILQILENYPSYTRLTWKSFPLLGIFPDRIYFAEALECAGEQEKFWPFLDAVVSEADSDIRKSGQQFIDANQNVIISADLNQNQFNNCFLEEKYKDLVTDMNNEAIKEGIDGVPITFVNNIKVPGAHENNFRNVVHEELKKGLMQDWNIYSDTDYKLKFFYPDSISIKEQSNADDDIQIINLTEQQSSNYYQVLYYKEGSNKRSKELKEIYNIESGRLIDSREINQHKVRYLEQLMNPLDGSPQKSRITISYLDTEIVDGVLITKDELYIEVWGLSNDKSKEFIRLLSIGFELE